MTSFLLFKITSAEGYRTFLLLNSTADHLSVCKKNSEKGNRPDKYTTKHTVKHLREGKEIAFYIPVKECLILY